MPSNPRRMPDEKPDSGLGSLRACLVEGDAEQQSRERRVRRRALVVSIFVQSVILAALVLVPLFGKTERLVAREFVPIPPYGHPVGHVRGNHRHGNPNPTTTGDHFKFYPYTVIPHPHASPTGDANNTGDSDLDSLEGTSIAGPVCTWCVPGDRNSGPRSPQPAVESSSKPRLVHMTTIDPALLIHRVEPVYPPLAVQIHKEGRVELRAIIATDGSIQSLQIVSGDVLFYESAKEAVSQWRYKPTFLNGQPVEIDTYITVIYTMKH